MKLTLPFHACADWLANATNKLLAAMSVVLVMASPCCGEQVAVELKDGRVARGHVHARTDDAYLWLHSEVQGVALQSGFAWDNVARVRQADRVISDEQLRSIAGIATPGRKPQDVEAYCHDAQGAAFAVRADGVMRHTPGSVESLRIEARLGQWDRDHVPDGVEVLVSPLDAAGRLVPIAGQLELQLHACQEPSRRGPRVAQVTVIERTSVMVRPQDFADGPAVVRLTFSHFDPNKDFNVAPEALVTARLNVPGRGVMQASDANVWLHEYSWLRDQLQYTTGQRYLGGGGK